MLIKFPKIDQIKLQSWLLSLGIFIGVLLIVGAILSSIKITTYATYTDPKSGIRVKFPAYWKVIDRPEGGALVAFLTPKSNDMDVFIENVNISVKDMSGTPMTPMEFSRETIKQLTGTFAGFISVLESQPMTVAYRPGYKFVYIGDVSKENLETVKAEYGISNLDNSNPLEYMYVWVLKDNRAYIMTYVAQKSEFDKYLKEVNVIIRSFEFI